MLRKLLRLAAAALFLTLLFAAALPATEIRVFKLYYSSPAAVARTCEALFRGQANFAAAPSINALVVNTDDKELFPEIEKLVKELDRKPVTLRFTVRSLGSSSEDQRRLRVGTGKFPDLRDDRQVIHRQSERSITVLENAKAQFTDDQVRVFSLPGWYGPEVVQLTTSHGLKVSGHVTGNGTVMIQVWYAQENGADTEQLLTELEVATGQWAEFGGLAQDGGHNNRSVTAGNDGELTTARGKSQIDSRFAIRVDLIR